MPEESDDPPQPPVPEQPTLLGNLAPDEMFARGMQSVKMTSGTAGTWQPPTIGECAQLFPGYEVLRLLGRGGMGAVYQAREIELDRLVAIKLLPLEVSVDKDFADRFRREARAMARLNHPNIITVYAFGTTREGHLYFVMEFVEGANLADVIHQVGLTGEQALSIVEQCCTALAYAHGKGIVHRDIKPANVMIDTESQVKIADFGLARLTDNSAADLGHTMTGTVMGTPDYMAPEQMKGMNVDHRADIYSLGVMVYEMLCREVPRGIFHAPSQRTGCDTRIDNIVIRAMQQAPEHRYQSTQEMKADVVEARVPVAEDGVGRVSPRVGGNPPLAGEDTGPTPPKPAPLRPPQKPAVPLSPGQRKPPAAPPPGNQNPTEVASQPPGASKPAALQAIPPPGPKKSKLPLYGGLAAALLVLGIAAAVLVPKLGGTRSVVSPASPDAAEKAGADPFDKLRAGSAAPSSATKDAPFVNSLGMKFVAVPIIGGPTSGQRVLFSVWDTRVQDYAPFARETKNEGAKPDSLRGPTHPAAHLSWADATAYCAWLTTHEQVAGRLPAGWRYRLPTDHEWSCAVGIGDREDPAQLPMEKNGRLRDVFPWGSQWPPPAGAGNYAGEELQASLAAGKYPSIKSVISGYNDGQVECSPVGSFAANLFGLFDMGGNVWQWCEDRFDQDGNDRVLRGSAWNNYAKVNSLSSSRVHVAPDDRYYYACGFRCVLVPASGSAPATTMPPTAALEPDATKLWDSPAKIPNQKGVSWENGVLHLDGSGANYKGPPSRDAVVRASIRMNSDARSPQLALRAAGDLGESARYVVGITGSATVPRTILLQTVVNGKFQPLATWHLPRAYGEDEWMQLELRAVGDELTVSADGQVLGKVHDSSQPQAGNPQVWAAANGYFRDIVYVPLDQPGSPAALRQSVAPPEPGKWIDVTAALRMAVRQGVLIEDGDWLVGKTGQHLTTSNAEFGNVIMRVRYRKAFQFKLREVTLPGGSARQYLFNLSESPHIAIHESGKAEVDLAPSGSFPADYQPDGEHEAVAMAYEDKLMLWVDGRLVQAVRDNTLARGTTSANTLIAGASFQKLEYGELTAPLPAEWLAKAFAAAAASAPGTQPAAAPTGAPPASRAASISIATKDAPFVNTLGMKFVPVPGADILMCVHETRRKDYAAFSAAAPGVDATWKAPLVDGKPLEQQDDHPVVLVSWEDAAAFCSWLSKKEGRTYRLPTEQEWNLAVVTGLDDPKSINAADLAKKLEGQYPWGTAKLSDADKLANYQGSQDGFEGTAPVMSFPPNHLGIYDLGGNAWEWCDGWMTPDHKQRVLRGGCYLNYGPPRKSSWRLGAESNFRSPPKGDYERRVPGFRCVLALTPSTPTAAALEPGAIRLWDSPEKIKSDAGVWQGDGFLLDNHSLRRAGGRDGILRASIKANADAQRPRLFVRFDSPIMGKENSYDLALVGDHLELSAFQLGIRRPLKSWPLPRIYRPDEWVPIQLRYVGDQFEVSVDGVLVGTVHDGMMLGSGQVGVHSNARGYFRDIVYVPLDQPGDTAGISAAGASAAAPAKALEPGAIKLWDAPSRVPSLKGMSWEDDSLRLDTVNSTYFAPHSSGCIVRCRVRPGPATVEIQIHLPSTTERPLEQNHYQLAYAVPRGEIILRLVGKDVGARELQNWKLPRAYRSDEWLALELRNENGKFTVSADGQPLGTAEDHTVSGLIGLSLWATPNGYFREIVYVPLDPAVVGSSTASPSPAPAAEPWQDLLHDPSKLFLPHSVTTGQDGLRFTQATEVRVLPGKGPEPDGAVRMRSTLDSVKVVIIARRSNAGQYQLSVDPHGKEVLLNRWAQNTVTVVRRFPLREPLQPGQEYELELRVVGQTLTAKLNGEILGTVTDNTFPEGQFGVSHSDPSRAIPVLVKTLEVLDLHASASAQATPTAEPWQAVSTGSADFDLHNAEVTPLGVRLEKGFLSYKKACRDGAVRLRTVFDPQLKLGSLPLRVRGTLSKTYNLNLVGGRESKLVLSRLVQGLRTDLGESPALAAVQPGQDIELELRVVGTHLMGKLNGQVVVQADDPTLAEGTGIMGVDRTGDGAILAKSVEFLILDQPSSAAREPAAPWQDGLRDVSNLAIYGPATATTEGITFSEGASVVLRGALIKDGAARLRGAFDPADHSGQLKLKVRYTADACYAVYIRDGSAVVLEAFANGHYSDLREFPLPAAWTSPRDYELELRAVGTKLTASLDGKVLGEVNDSTVQSGQFSIGSKHRAVVKGFQYLMLDSSTNSAAKAQPSSPRSVNDAASKVTKDAPSSEPWQDMLASPNSFHFTGGAEQTAAGIVLPNRGWAYLYSQGADGAVRLRAAYPNAVNVYVRHATEGGATNTYRVIIANRSTVQLHCSVDGRASLLREFTLSPPLDPGTDFELEVRAVGPAISIRMNETLLGEVQDSTLPRGHFAIANYTDPPVVMKALSYLPLPATPPPGSPKP